MYTPYIVLALILIIAAIMVQLIKMNSYMLKIIKSDELNRVESKEEGNWEFIKGLY